MRRVLLPFASVALVLVACNALTGVSDLKPCDSCGDDGSVPVITPPDMITPDARADANEEEGGQIIGDSGADADAKVVSDADANADAEAGIGCQGVAACERVAFVTSLSYTGDLGGVTGADAKCQAAANGISAVTRIKGRTFFAWISTTTTSPAARMTHGTLAYVNADGTTIADDWDDLIDGSLKKGISVDEKGNNQGGEAWTGTKSNGATYSGDACTNWTSMSFATPGERGNVGGTGSGWSNGNLASCGTTAKLYCIER